MDPTHGTSSIKKRPAWAHNLHIQDTARRVGLGVGLLSRCRGTVRVGHRVILKLKPSRSASRSENEQDQIRLCERGGGSIVRTWPPVRC